MYGSTVERGSYIWGSIHRISSCELRITAKYILFIPDTFSVTNVLPSKSALFEATSHLTVNCSA